LSKLGMPSVERCRRPAHRSLRLLQHQLRAAPSLQVPDSREDIWLKTPERLTIDSNTVAQPILVDFTRLFVSRYFGKAPQCLPCLRASFKRRPPVFCRRARTSKRFRGITFRADHAHQTLADLCALSAQFLKANSGVNEIPENGYCPVSSSPARRCSTPSRRSSSREA
jgi:hypothetical protein